MKRVALAVALLIGLATPSQADYQDGVSAYKRGDYSTAYREFLPLAEKGHIEAQASLGIMYLAGWGVPRDYAKAMIWFRSAAEHGNATAQSFLGTMYSAGWGLPKDYGEAAKWRRRAAEQGQTGAQFELGRMYEDGIGVPQEFVLAHMWFNLAASASPSDEIRRIAVVFRDSVAKRMTPAQIAEAQRLARHWMAAFNKRKKK